MRLGSAARAARVVLRCMRNRAASYVKVPCPAFGSALPDTNETCHDHPHHRQPAGHRSRRAAADPGVRAQGSRLFPRHMVAPCAAPCTLPKNSQAATASDYSLGMVFNEIKFTRLGDSRSMSEHLDSCVLYLLRSPLHAALSTYTDSTPSGCPHTPSGPSLDGPDACYRH